MQILVTGGAGYIGSILTERLLAEGHHVVVADNFMYGQWSLGHLIHNPRLKVIRADVRDLSAMKPWIRECEVIMPLAAIVGAPACKKDPIAAHTINLESPLALFKELSAEQWVLMPTTNSAYGTTPAGEITTEKSPLNPLSDYARHKVEVEKALMDRKNSLSFRLATVFGTSPRMRLDLLVNDFTYRAVTDKFLVLFEAHFRRNYVHVQDVASVFMHGLANFEKMRGEIYNVGLSEANLTKRELCEQIQRQAPEFYFTEASMSQDPDKRDYEVSNAKIEATGWKAQVGLEAGIRELIRAYAMLGGDRFGNV